MDLKIQKTVLLVEDESIIAMAEAQTIKRFGYNVIVANSGEKAEYAEETNRNIDLVLMDVNLGRGIDGIESARRILRKRKVPIVFLTSHPFKDCAERLKGVSDYGYFSKNAFSFLSRSYIEHASTLQTRTNNFS